MKMLADENEMELFTSFQSPFVEIPIRMLGHEVFKSMADNQVRSNDVAQVSAVRVRLVMLRWWLRQKTEKRRPDLLMIASKDTVLFSSSEKEGTSLQDECRRLA